MNCSPPALSRLAMPKARNCSCHIDPRLLIQRRTLRQSMPRRRLVCRPLDHTARRQALPMVRRQTVAMLLPADWRQTAADLYRPS
jgi:hypothetical protein